MRKIILQLFIYILRKPDGGRGGSSKCLHWLTRGRGGVQEGPNLAYVIYEWPLTVGQYFATFYLYSLPFLILKELPLSKKKAMFYCHSLCILYFLIYSACIELCCVEWRCYIVITQLHLANSECRLYKFIVIFLKSSFIKKLQC